MTPTIYFVTGAAGFVGRHVVTIANCDWRLEHIALQEIDIFHNLAIGSG